MTPVLWCLMIFLSPVDAQSSSSAVQYLLKSGTNSVRSAFVAWEHYLQECAAELPHNCSAVKKALDQQCITDDECVAPAVCLQSVCKCPNGHAAERGRCIKLPTIDQPCLEGKCANPLVCSKNSICSCPRTMERINNECDPKCNKTEISVDGKCLTTSRLGGSCTENAQCLIAYSYCSKGKCECINGTRPSNDRCSVAAACPDGQQPLKDPKGRNDVIKCYGQTCASDQLPSQPTKLKLDSCPESSFCVFPSYQDAEGFCCPEKPYCPMGEPLRDKNCINPRSQQERCPPETHHCYVGLRAAFCCPLPCPSISGQSAVVDKGRCYVKKSLHDTCVVSAQCPEPSQCMNGTCECVEGDFLQYGPFGGHCKKICSPSEVLVGAQCMPLVVPSKECNNSAQCTAGTRCINRKCQCPCGTVSYNGKCVDKPDCPDFGNGVYDPLKTKTGVILECSPSVNVARNSSRCPKRSFCHKAAVYSGGICCPLPEPVCAGAAEPSRNRDNNYTYCDLLPPEDGTTETYDRCPRNADCYDFVSSLLPSMGSGPRSTQGVCCPRLVWKDSPSRPAGIQHSAVAADVCPAYHRLVTVSGGHTLRCSFGNYRGECGLTAGCFPASSWTSANALISNLDGVCCSWQSLLSTIGKP